MKTENPFSYLKKTFPGFRTQGKEILRREAERLLDLLEKSIESRATSDAEMELADTLGIVQEGKNLHVTVIQDRISSGESSSLLLRRMEMGTAHTPVTKPIYYALKEFENV